MAPAATARIRLRFALSTALAIAAVGVAVLWFARHEELARAEQSVGFHAKYVADTILREHLRRADLQRPVHGRELARLDALVRHEILVGGALRVKLWSPDGIVTYSNDHSLIGRHTDELPELRKALGGVQSRNIARLNGEGGEGRDVKAVEVYTPVTLRDGKGVAGVFELYESYEPIASAVRDAILPLATILLVALLALWAALLPLLRRTTQALQRSLLAHREAADALETTAEQLRQSQKMDAIGRLAGGVAHDFNNLLLAITGYTEFLLDGIADSRLRGYAEEVRKAAARAAGLTQQLLAFSRRQVLQPQVIELNEAVRDVEAMLRRLVEADVRIELELDPELHLVEADPGQIAQVLLNLAVNAQDAMDGSGVLTISTVNEDDHVVLRVSDSGIGISEETRARIFEPFFTTKAVGEGTGLGLATVYGIVAQSSGTISVESAPGEGATFVIRLPRTERRPTLPPVLAPTALGGSERILVVEDDDSVRTLVSDMLREQGYEVIVAGSPHDALGLADPWDLLIADVMMPGMNGVELARRLGAQRVLYISGYDGQALVGENAPFLQKPFTKSQLTSKVRELLDERRAA